MYNYIIHKLKGGRNVKTVKVKLKPTKPQALELKRMSLEYIRQANLLIRVAESEGKFPNYTSKNIESNLPSSVKNELIRYAKSKYQKYGKCFFKKQTVSWNNQNFSVNKNSICFPMMKEGKAKRTLIKAIIPDELYSLISSSKLGSLRVTKKGHHWMALLSIPIPLNVTSNTDILGVDLGILCPAVGVIKSSGKTIFLGNGRQNKFVRRKYNSLRKELSKKKKIKAIKNIRDKESLIMRDVNHKISRKLIRFAIDNHCGVIHLEDLSGIHRTSKAGGKNKANLHNWSFYELSSFIKYKAREAGIKVVQVDPEYTSQECPSCGQLNKVKSRQYLCLCGYKAHRDRVGAINIAKKT